jgi:hypothetical protein
MEAFLGPDQGIVGLFVNESRAGRTVDLYADRRRKSQLLPLGSLYLHTGSNNLFFRIIGRNAGATGSGFDPISFIFKRAD